MINTNILFVILNFNNYMDTINCVDSIKLTNPTEYIVVLDNGSRNNSFSELVHLYNENDNVIIVQSLTNLGYSNGFNFVLDFAKGKYLFNYIVLLNNDIIVKTPNIYSILQMNEDKMFHIAGPFIWDSSIEKNLNPLPNKKIDIKNLNKMILIKIFRIISNYTYINLLFPKFKKQNRIKKNDEEENIVIQGSFIIFNKTFFEYYNRLFDKTFLYFEEYILKYYCDLKKLKIVYLDHIKIEHLGSKSTKLSFKNSRSRKLFYLKHSLRSIIEFKKMIIKNEVI